MIPARGFHLPNLRPSIVRLFERGESLDDISKKVSNLNPGASVVRRGVEDQIRIALMELRRRTA